MEDDEPLLQERGAAAADRGDGGAASLPGAVFNISTSIIGAGIMSIPAAMRVLGVAPALALIAAVAILCDRSVEFLLRHTTAAAGSKSLSPAGADFSYAAVMAESFGPWGSTALRICVTLLNAGALIIYLIIIGDVVSGSGGGGGAAAAHHTGLLQEWFGEHWSARRPVALLFIVVLVMLPLVLLRRIGSLRYSSALSVLLAVVFVFISSGMAVASLLRGTAEAPRILPDLSNDSSSFFDLFTAVPVVVSAFTFHFNVHPIRAELRRDSDMKAAVRVSLLLCSAIYAAVGFSCYLLFGDATMSDVLSNFDGSSSGGVGAVVADVVRLSYALHLAFVFPLLLFSLRANAGELLFPKSSGTPLTAARFVPLTGAILLSVYSAAIAVPNIWVLFQFFGATASACLSLVFPGAVVLRDVHGIWKPRDRAVAAAMIVLAVVTSSVAIASNVAGYLSSS